MIVICEECGKKYRVDPDKIKGSTIRFKCRSCGHLSMVTKIPAQQPGNGTEKGASSGKPEMSVPSRPAPSQEGSTDETPEEPTGKKWRLGIRAKMILLFFVLPSVLSGLAVMLTLQQNYRIANNVMSQSKQVMIEAGKDLVLARTAAMADQLRLYLQNKPYLTGNQFASDPGLMQIVEGGITRSGYAVVYSEPQEGNREEATVWVHPEGGAIGQSVADVMQPTLGNAAVGFFDLFNKALAGRRIDGTLTPGDGGEQWLVAFAPVEGQPYGVVMLTPQQGFDQPLRTIEAATQGNMRQALLMTLVIMGVAFVAIGIVVSLFGHRLTGKLHYLTSVTDKISVGDLETEIEPMSDDEIGDLAEAIGRMQDSLKLAIERLRRRR